VSSKQKGWDVFRRLQSSHATTGTIYRTLPSPTAFFHLLGIDMHTEFSSTISAIRIRIHAPSSRCTAPKHSSTFSPDQTSFGSAGPNSVSPIHCWLIRMHDCQVEAITNLRSLSPKDVFGLHGRGVRDPQLASGSEEGTFHEPFRWPALSC